MKCPLCGHEFNGNDPELSKKCRGCPIGRLCKLTCCPKCGYSFPAVKEKKETLSKAEK